MLAHHSLPALGARPRPEVDDISTGGEKYIPQEDGSLLAQGYAPTKHNVKLTAKTSLRNITAFKCPTKSFLV